MGLRRTSRGSIDLPEVRYEFGTDGDDPVEPGGGAPARLLIAGAVAGLVALWLVSGLASGGSDRTQRAAAATATAPVLVVPSPVPTPLPTPVPTPTSTPAPGEVSFVDDRAARIAWSQLSTAGPSHGVAYTADSGLAVLEFSTGVVTVVERLQAVGGTVDLGGNSDLGLGFGPDELAFLLRTSSDRVVARGAASGTIVDASLVEGSLVVIDATTGDELARHAVPQGATLRPIDGYGVTAHVTGEGTYVAGTDDLALITEGELLTGNGVSWVERRCDRTCSIVLTDAGGDEHVLPDSFDGAGSRYLLSPNGAYMLRITAQGAGELFVPESGAVWWVNGSGIGAAAWAPDSSFIAWIDETSDPLLKLMLPERADWIVVDLGLLGAAPPAGGELAVLVANR